MSLFGGSAAATAQPRSRNLIEFKAGKMNLRGTTVYPDKRKGLVYLYQGNDLLMHLCWKDRSNNALVDDHVIFPDEVEFKKVTQNTTGRVYLLKWKSNNKKLFFWMQEPKEDKDEEYCRKVNDLLNNPPPPGFDDDDDAIAGAHPLRPLLERMAAGRAGGIDPNDLTHVLRGMDPSEFASLLSSFRGGGGGPGGLMQGLHRGRASGNNTTSQSTTTTTTATTTTRTTTSSTVPSSNSPNNRASSSPATVPTTTVSSAPNNARTNPVQMSALTSVLSNLRTTTTQEATTTTTTSQNPSKTTADLHDLIKSETLIPLLCNRDVQEKLRIYLPENESFPSTEKELRESISSPQFLQMVNAFSFALQSGELGAILTQSGFPDNVIQAANQGDLPSFAQAINNHYKTSNEKNDQEKSSDDHSMDTDE